jgi:hypothetical protein
MTPEMIAAMRAYLRQWIGADWPGGEYLDRLRASIDGLTSRDAIADWLDEAFFVEIDPL